MPVRRFTPRPLTLAVHAALICLLAAPAPAHALTEPTPLGQSYQLPAQPLASALRQFALDYSITLVFEPELVKGKNAPPLRGAMNVEQGLHQLIGYTSLELIQIGENSYTLRQTLLTMLPMIEVSAIKPLAVVASAGDVTLPSVEVEAAKEGSSANAYRSQRASVAGLANESLQDTPYSVTVLSQELLKNQQVDNVGEMDRFDAAISSSTVSNGWFSLPKVRGFDLSNWDNYLYNGGKFMNQNVIGLENKQRVEVLKGLAALQAGFAAPGGLINYVTERPLAQPFNEVGVTVDSEGNLKTTLDVSRRSSDGRFGIRVNASVQNEKSFVDQVDGLRPFASLAADWRITDDTLLQLDVEHERRKQNHQPQIKLTTDGQLPRNHPRTFLGQDWVRFETERTTFSGGLTHYFSPQWSATASANWTELERTQRGLYLGDIAPDGETNVTLFDGRQTYTPLNFSASVQGQVQTASLIHDVKLGASRGQFDAKYNDGFWDEIGNTNIYQPRQIADPKPEMDPKYLAQKNIESGLFLQDVISVGEAWKIHLGGRWAQRKETSLARDGSVEKEYKTDVFSPNAAIIFKPSESVSVYGSFMQGLESGGTAPQTAQNRDEQMPPLTSTQYEVGVKSNLGLADVELAIFQLDKAAEMLNQANVYVQDGLQRHRGLDLSASGLLTPEWMLRGSAMLLDAKYIRTDDPSTEGKRPTDIPEHRFTLLAEYSPKQWTGLTLSGNFAYTGAKMLNDQNTGVKAPAYAIVGLGARYSTKIAGQASNFWLNVDNVFNERYWANAKWGELDAGAPRSVSLSVDTQF